MPDYKRRPSQFRRWMRRDGISIWFVFWFITSWIIINSFLVVSIPHPPFPPLNLLSAGTVQDLISWSLEALMQQSVFYQINEFGLLPTLLLLGIRIRSFLFLQVHIFQIGRYVFGSAPDPDGDGDVDVSTGASDQKGYQTSKVLSDLEICKSVEVHCICIRIISRGDKAAQPLIRAAVTTAVRLLHQFCNCKHLKVHIVTQTRFLDEDSKKLWLGMGATEIREVYVPSNYKTPNGSLYKARNICFWEESGGIGKECDQEKSWILSLDEEAIITKSFLVSFVKDVLLSADEPRVGYAFGPCLMDVNAGPISYLVKILEARSVSFHTYFVAKEPNAVCDVIYFHGGAFFARASIDRAVGNDWGPLASVAEDFATGHQCHKKQVGIKHLNGWFSEFMATTTWAHIQHEARVLRGQIYVICRSNLGPIDFLLAIKGVCEVVLWPLFSIFFALVVILAPSVTQVAGPSCFFLDMCVALYIAGNLTSYAFGAFYLHLTITESLGCLLLSPFMFFIGYPLIRTVANAYSAWSMFKDWHHGTTTFEVTSKSSKDT